VRAFLALSYWTRLLLRILNTRPTGFPRSPKRWRTTTLARGLLRLAAVGPTLVAARPRRPRHELAPCATPSVSTCVAVGVAAVAALALSEALHVPSFSSEALSTVELLLLPLAPVDFPCSDAELTTCGTAASPSRRRRVRHPRRQPPQPLSEEEWPFCLFPEHIDDPPDPFTPLGWAEEQKLKYLSLHHADLPARAYRDGVFWSSGGSDTHAERARQAQRTRCLAVVHQACHYERSERRDAFWLYAALAEVTRGVPSPNFSDVLALISAQDQRQTAVGLPEFHTPPVDDYDYDAPPMDEAAESYDPHDTGYYDSG